MKKLILKYYYLLFAFFLLSFAFFGKTILIESNNTIDTSVSHQHKYSPIQKSNREVLIAKSIFNSDLHKDKAEITETEIEEDDVQEITSFSPCSFYLTYLAEKLPFNHSKNVKNGLKTSIYKNYLSSILPIHILFCVYRI